MRIRKIKEIDSLLSNDEISPEEAAFMTGYEQ